MEYSSYEAHGIHPAALIKDYEKLVWLNPTARSARCRVKQYTCDCKTIGVIYELCMSGGLMFIRKTYRDGKLETRYETHRWAVQYAESVWLDLISGRVY